MCFSLLSLLQNIEVVTRGQRNVYSETVKIVNLPKNDESLAAPQFDVASLDEVLAGLEEFPVLIVTISGQFRSGKSFLMNLMATYLEHLQNVIMDTVNYKLRILENIFYKEKSQTTPESPSQAASWTTAIHCILI